MSEVIVERDYPAEQQRAAKFERAIAAFNALPVAERQRRKQDGLKPEEDTSPIIRRSTVPLGHLIAGTAFVEANDIRKLALLLMQTLNAVLAVEQAGTDTTATSTLTKLLREMTDRPRALDDAITGASFTPLFFEVDNLDRLERWSRSESKFSYHRDGSALIVEDASNGKSRVEPLPESDIPSLSIMGGGKYLDDKFLPEMA